MYLNDHEVDALFGLREEVAALKRELEAERAKSQTLQDQLDAGRAICEALDERLARHQWQGMTWRPFEPSKDEVKRVARDAEENTCNRHSDCAAADKRARATGRLGADHCHSDECEECFGS